MVRKTGGDALPVSYSAKVLEQQPEKLLIPATQGTLQKTSSKTWAEFCQEVFDARVVDNLKPAWYSRCKWTFPNAYRTTMRKKYQDERYGLLSFIGRKHAERRRVSKTSAKEKQATRRQAQLTKSALINVNAFGGSRKSRKKPMRATRKARR